MTDFERPVPRPGDRRRPTTTCDRGAGAADRHDAARPRAAPRRRRPGRAPQPRPLARAPAWSSRSSSASTAVATLSLTGASPTVHGRRLRPGRQRRVRRAAPRPARRPAPGGRRVPEQVPGLRRPGRPRHQARRGPRPAARPRSTDGKQTYTARHQAVVRRRARRSRWARCRRTDGASRDPPTRRPTAAALAPPVDQGRGARPGLVHGRPRRDGRHEHDRRPTTAPS